MLQAASARYVQFSTWAKIIFVFLALTFSITFVEFFIMAEFAQITDGLPLIDNYSSYTPLEAYNLITNYGEEGRSFYNFIQLVDTLIPLFSGLFYSMFISKLLSLAFPNNKSRWIIGLYPLLITLFDYAENIGVFFLLRTYITPIPIIAQYTLIMHTFKMFFYVSTFIVLFITLITVIFKVFLSK